MKGIIFTTESVQAIQALRKTMTRRVIVPQPTNPRWNNIGWLGWDDGHGYKIPRMHKVGDILYVKEGYIKIDGSYCYRADEQPETVLITMESYKYKWRSPMYMPQAAARYFLQVAMVRVERLQDITEADAKAEGIEPKEPNHVVSAKYRFGQLWNSLNKKRGHPWADNPWITAVTFRQISRAEAEREVK